MVAGRGGGVTLFGDAVVVRAIFFCVACNEMV